MKKQREEAEIRTMEIRNWHIGWWLGSMMMLLCLACGGSDSDGDMPDSSGPQLEIRVYTPEPLKVTRGEYGDIEADDAEKAINSLSIWVFEHDNGQLVGYLNPADLPTTEAKIYRITVSEEFANSKPEVDIYVMANVTNANTGLSLNRNSTRSNLEDAIIEGSHFGLTSPVLSVPDGGLPMSGVLKKQPVDGIAPIVKVSTNVKVVRAVSKVRFVFSNSAQATDGTQDLKITSITINSEMIPDKEYLFLDGPYTGMNLKLGASPTYNLNATTLITPSQNDPPVATYQTPADYAYVNQTGQEYETLINQGITDNHLSDMGKCYLRESDKIVTGTVNYTIGGEAKKPATFTMNEAGEFSRNHSWIVYGYFAGKDNLKIFSVKLEEWITTNDTHDVYNW